MSLDASVKPGEDRWSRVRFEEMAELWKLTPKDISKMRDLQDRLSDINHYKNDPFDVVRYYKEFHGKVARAEKAFRATLDWRRAHRMDTFLANYGAPDPLFHQWPQAVLNTTDLDGDPIYIERFGATDYSNFMKEFGSDGALEYSALYTRELMEQRSFWKPYEDHVGKRVKQYTMIVDLEGAGLEFLRPSLIRYLQKMSVIAQQYYLGWAKRIILLRAPRVFKYGWSAIKPLLAKEVQDKLVFTNTSDYLDVLPNYIALHNLPPCVYPKGLAQGMPGYFEKVRLRGGTLEGSATFKERQISLTSTTYAGECSEELSEWSHTESNRTNVSVSVLVKGVWGETGRSRRILQATTASP